MSGCIEQPIIEKIRDAYIKKEVLFTDEELRSFCVDSSCKKLRNEVKDEDYELVKWMITHDNCYFANLGQALLRPFIEKFNKKDELKSFLINLCESTENDSLKSGLLFDLFFYSEDELTTEFINKSFSYLEEKRCAFSQMLKEWLEDKGKILEIIQNHLKKNDSNPLKTALWLFSLISVSYDKSEEVKKILDIYKNRPEPIIRRSVDFVNKEIELLPKKDEALNEIAQNWLEYLSKLKQSLKEGAESVFDKDNVEIRIFINVTNRHLPYQKGLPENQEIPQLLWRYVGLEEDDIVSRVPNVKSNVKRFLEVELFGGGFISSDFHVEDYIKVITLKDYFSSTDDINSIENRDLQGFIESLISDENYKHPRNEEEENSLREILNSKLNGLFDGTWKTNKERWEKILKLVEREFLFTEDQIQKGISIMLAVTFGAYYPMDIFVTLIPKSDDKDSLVSKLKCAIKLSKHNGDKKSEAVSFWKLPLDKLSRTKITLLERAFSQVVMHLFTKIYALYFQHLITRGKGEIIRQGLSVMLSAPIEGPCGIKAEEINENTLVVQHDKWFIKGTCTGSNKGQVEKNIEKALKSNNIDTIDKVRKKVEEIVNDSGKNSLVFLKETDSELRVKLGNLLIQLPYPTHLDPGEKKKEQEYKEITRFKVNELLTKLEEYYTDILNEQKKLRMKDAVVAIMGRNMSHNIGSHVLWHLAEDHVKHEKRGIEDILQKRFYTYLRERMGFIALIATSKPTWAVETDLSQIINPFVEVRQENGTDIVGIKYLLENIVKTEDIRKEGKIYKFLPKVECSIDKKIDLPHGSYGAHAFYTIVENIIRNTIKHNLSAIPLPENTTIPVTFTITADEPDVEEWKRDYHRIKVTDDLPKYSCESLDSLITKLNEKADEEIFYETGRRRTTNLGFKEKRICAAFLRMIPQEKIDSEELNKKINENKEPRLLTIEKQGNNLSHVIYLLKPKNVLIATDKESLLNISNKNILEDAGIYIVSKDQFFSLERLTYKFLILDFKDESSLGLVRRVIQYPFRIFIRNRSINFKPVKVAHINLESNMLENADSFYSNLWETWLKQQFGDFYKTKRVIFDETRGIHENLNNIYETNPLKTINQNHICLFHKKKINSNIFESSFYCEAYSSTIDLGGIISNLSANPVIGYQLFESFCWRIAVVDERIFERKDKTISLRNWDLKPYLFKLWSKRGVSLLDHNKFIDGDWTDITSSNPDILIVHQGVIDKFIDKNTGDRNVFSQRWCNEIGNKIPYLIIDSDRGEPDPDHLRELGTRWLQFSDLADILIHKADNNLAKFLLVSLLTAIRGG